MSNVFLIASMLFLGAGSRGSERPSCLSTSDSRTVRIRQLPESSAEQKVRTALVASRSEVRAERFCYAFAKTKARRPVRVEILTVV